MGIYLSVPIPAFIVLANKALLAELGCSPVVCFGARRPAIVRPIDKLAASDGHAGGMSTGKMALIVSISVPICL